MASWFFSSGGQEREEQEEDEEAASDTPEDQEVWVDEPHINLPPLPPGRRRQSLALVEQEGVGLVWRDAADDEETGGGGVEQWV